MTPVKIMLLMALATMSAADLGCDRRGQSGSSGSYGPSQTDNSRVISQSQRADGAVVRYLADGSAPAGTRVIEEISYPTGQISQSSMSQEDYKRLRGHETANRIRWGTNDPDQIRQSQQRLADQQQRWQRQADGVNQQMQQFNQVLQQAHRNTAQEQEQTRRQAENFGRQVNNFFNGLQGRR